MASRNVAHGETGIPALNYASAEGPSGYSMIDMLNRGWRLADAGGHALGRLLGAAIDSYRLVVMVSAPDGAGATSFQVFLLDPAGEVSRAPVLSGLYRPGENPDQRSVEVLKFSTQAVFGPRETDLTAGELRQLFGYLADLVPPGGQMTVEYERGEHQDTAQSLEQGIPPILTPLGHMLFSVGCAGGFKDCRPSTENRGPRKLQSFKPLNSQHALLKVEEFRREIKAFHERTSAGQNSYLETVARERALDILIGFRARIRPPRSGADNSLFFG